MSYVTLNTAASLTGLSKRTLWRRIADEHLHAQSGAEQGEHARVSLDDVLKISRLKLTPEDWEMVLDADAGEAEAECDLGLEFLIQNLPEDALRWFRESATRGYPEAMHQLGRCYIAGHGIEANETLGIEWISRAAAAGHSTAKHLAQYLMDPTRPPMQPAEFEAKLDAIEKNVVLKALRDTADPA